MQSRLTQLLIGFGSVALASMLSGCSKDSTPFNPIAFIKEIDPQQGPPSLNQLVEKSEGGFLLVGGPTVYSIDSRCDLVWKKSIPVENYVNTANLSVCEMSTGRFLIASQIATPDFSQYRLAVLQMDTSGSATQLFTEDLIGQSNWARILPDGGGGFYLAYLVSEDDDQYLSASSLILKHFNGQNGETWSTTLEDLYWKPDMQIAPDGDIFIEGSTYPNPLNIQTRHLACARLHPDGSFVWRKDFGDASYDVGYSVDQFGIGGVVVSGQLSYSNTPYLFQLDENGDIQQKLALSETIYIYQNEIRLLKTG